MKLAAEKIVEELKKLGITPEEDAPYSALVVQLKALLCTRLDNMGVSFDVQAGPRALLELYEKAAADKATKEAEPKAKRVVKTVPFGVNTIQNHEKRIVMLEEKIDELLSK